MALFVRQDENRTELQTRIAAELQDKARKKAAEADLPDGVEDSQYMKGTKQTSKYAWIWIIVFIAAVAALIFIIISALGANTTAPR